MRLLDGRKQFGVGTGRALPKSGLKFVYSKRSDRLKQVVHDDKLFATIRPNGVIAPTYYGACLLMKSKAYAENSVVVEQAAVEFVSEGRSVFCKFVKGVGKHVLPSGEVAVLDPAGRVIAVGNARVHGDFMRTFKAGVAVKVRGVRE
jgi:predicted RNA-binding protein (TIGR00451 family)